MSPESAAYFAAAERADWPGLFDAIAAMHQAMREGRSRNAPWAVYPAEWAVVNEVGAALEVFAAWEEKYAIAFATDIISSIPPASIFFGGTDPGRFLVTALSRSHVQGDPFFTLTQDALTHRSYLRYVRGMYGSRISVPTDEDADRALREYEEDARCRRNEGKLLPGETLEEVEGKLEIRGQVSVMAINGLLTKLMFEKNPEREFYIEESFPLRWMYPHLSPHGLILRINRQPFSELPEKEVQRDRAYWRRYIGPMVGDWLKLGTSLAEVVGFVDKVYLNQDLNGFSGDPEYIQNEMPQRCFAKLRASIAGLYAWRAEHTQNSDEKERMSKEAEFAFRQAFVLCPAGPEAVVRYVNLLLGQKRVDDAILVTEAAVRLQEGGSQNTEAKSPAGPDHARSQLDMMLNQLKKTRTR